MITLSAPIVTSSPIATPSWIRTCPRMSHERPRIAPSISELRPMCVDASITERVVRVRSRRVTLFESTECEPTLAPGALRQRAGGADARPRRDTAVVPDVRRPLDLLEVADLHALAEPDVPADPDAR